MADYKVINRTEVATQTGNKNTNKFLVVGEIVVIDWFWDKDPLTGYGKIVEGSYTGFFANRSDLEEVIGTDPTDPPPDQEEPPVEDKYDHVLLSEFYEDGSVVLNQEFVPLTSGEESL